MNFDFPAALAPTRDRLRSQLSAHFPGAARAALDGDPAPGRALWSSLAAIGLAAPDDPLLACIAAEELGRALAPVPLVSTALAAGLIRAAGTEAQQRRYVPALAAGVIVATLAVVEHAGGFAPGGIAAIARHERLSGVKMPVLDGGAADIALVAARGDDGLSLFIVDLHGPGVARQPVPTIDPTRPQACIAFAEAPAEPLGPPGAAWPLIEAALDHAAVLVAFEQLGGAERALEMARGRALSRRAFGRPIGAFQSIKHILADMYVAVTLARSNAYFGAWALLSDPAPLPAAAATARVSATAAFQLCARQNIEVHGALGVTWDSDCHLLYRRSALLAGILGGQGQWEARLVSHLFARAA